MAHRIGTEVSIVVQNPQWNVNGPDLLTELIMAERNIKNIQKIQVLSGILNAIAIRSTQVQDPITLKLLEQIGFLVKETPAQFNEDFDDI